jgi:hypothetical protein
MRRRASQMAREGVGQRAAAVPDARPARTQVEDGGSAEKARKPDCRTAYRTWAFSPRCRSSRTNSARGPAGGDQESKHDAETPDAPPSIGFGRVVNAWRYSMDGLAGAWRTEAHSGRK